MTSAPKREENFESPASKLDENKSPENKIEARNAIKAKSK